MKDRNEFFFSGTVERFDRIQTKTGTAMVSFSVMCWREHIRCIAFRDLAEQTTLTTGDRVEVRGHIQSNEWTDKDGNRRQGWQVIAHEIHIAADEQQEAPRPPARQAPRPAPPEQQRLFPEQGRDCGDRHAYRGGPF